MMKFQCDEFFLSKVAFQAGYTNVYYNEEGPTGHVASVGKWITDDTVVSDFAADNNMKRIEKDDGDIFELEGEELMSFLSKYDKEVNAATKLSVDELLFKSKLVTAIKDNNN